MNVIVFAPHPDDEVIGCGGSIITHVAQGDSVTVVFVTSGEAGNRNQNPEQLSKIREAEAAKSCTALGVQKMLFLRQADGYVTASADFLNMTTELLRELKPSLVYLPHDQDNHVDHRVINQVLTEAINRAGGNAFPRLKGDPWKVGTVLGYEVWTPLASFQYVNDISDVMSQKMRALSFYTSQLANVAYDEGTKGLNRYRGAMTQVGEYAEVFRVLTLSSEIVFAKT